ncbi:hypothetical protein CJ030_MR1G023385 [Morella rubra]|uniref:Uncharacterized protein n=1 Tax=Morella rubra TaxID=262757 RepID=A0A6A1WN71_9ROSI|nr:hypothetical protein CJ030_MR1G023385 [Morella rubra]
MVCLVSSSDSKYSSTAIDRHRAIQLEAPLKMGAPAMPPPWVAQLFADLDNRVNAVVKIALQPLEEHVKKLNREVQRLREDQWQV